MLNLKTHNQGHIAGLRIGISQIKVVELNKQDISAYAYQVKRLHNKIAKRKPFLFTLLTPAGKVTN